jgi:hypothetical protein
MNSRLRALAAALCTALVCLGASLASADITQTEDLVIKTTDTPKVRFEQTGGGFGTYVWDVAGNEANFFIRDVTDSSHLPFRLRPGAPTNSITADAQGDVGFGLIDANAPLEIARSGAVSARYTDTGPNPDVSWATGIPAGGGSFTIGVAGKPTAMTLAPAGDVALLGSISEAATVAGIAGPQPVDAAALLTKIGTLPVRNWSYAATPGTRHLGPLAGEFSAAFGLGSAGAISPADVAGVSLAGVQGLITQNAALTARVQGAETANKKLSKKVGKLGKQMKKLRKAVAKLAK